MRVYYLKIMIFWHRYWVNFHLKQANKKNVDASTHMIRARRHTWKRHRKCDDLADKDYFDAV
jgi:hypothetical protein